MGVRRLEEAFLRPIGVILNAVKDLAFRSGGFFASLRMTFRPIRFIRVFRSRGSFP